MKKIVVNVAFLLILIITFVCFMIMAYNDWYIDKEESMSVLAFPMYLFFAFMVSMLVIILWRSIVYFLSPIKRTRINDIVNFIFAVVSVAEVFFVIYSNFINFNHVMSEWSGAFFGIIILLKCVHFVTVWFIELKCSQ